MLVKIVTGFCRKNVTTFVSRKFSVTYCYTLIFLTQSWNWNDRPFEFFFCGAAARRGPRPPHCRGFTITLRHTPLRRTPLNEWSARRRDLYLEIHNTQNKLPCPRRADPRFRPFGHWDRRSVQLFNRYYSFSNWPLIKKLGDSVAVLKYLW